MIFLMSNLSYIYFCNAMCADGAWHYWLDVINLWSVENVSSMKDFLFVE